MKRNSKGKIVISALIFFGLAFSILPTTKSSARSLNNGNKEVNDWLREVKPVAGRNRRRPKSSPSISTYPRANPDNIQVSPLVDKLSINVLSNDNGHKLRLVDINARSAEGARVSVRNGMAVYQVSQGFVGKDSFWYTLEDRSGRQHSAKVVVCICGR